MKTILHIGMPKTGSTALQDSLNRSHDGLLAHGVLYPENPGKVGFINHKYIVADLLDHDRLPRHLVRGQDAGTIADKQRAFRRHLMRQVRDARPRGLVISTESLFRSFNQAARDKLAALFADLRTEPEAVAYLRKPSAHFASALQQHIKASSIVRAPKVPHYRSVIGSYEKLLGRGRVHLNLFDRAALHEGDIVADFAVKYLGPLGVPRSVLLAPETTNETLSAESVDILRDFRATFHADRQDLFTADTNGLIHALAAIDARLQSPRPRLVEGLADLIDQSSPDPLWLRDSHGLVFPGYDYARAERGPLTVLPDRDWTLEALLQIDPALRAAIAADLAATPWAAEDPARAAWAAGLAAATPPAALKGTLPMARPPAPAAAAKAPKPRKDRPAGKAAAAGAGGKGKGGGEKAGPKARMLADIAKALWKAEQKAANPAVTAEALKAGWPGVREARLEQTRAILKVVRKAGYVPVPADPAADAAKE
jgi:hypothetical protein